MDAAQECKVPSRVNVHQSSMAGLAWFGAWLFTIGYLHLSFWMSVLALVIWPYFIGVHFGLTAR
jgi:hypothetical protein